MLYVRWTRIPIGTRSHPPAIQPVWVCAQTYLTPSWWHPLPRGTYVGVATGQHYAQRWLWAAPSRRGWGSPHA